MMFNGMRRVIVLTVAALGLLLLAAEPVSAQLLRSRMGQRGSRDVVYATDTTTTTMNTTSPTTTTPMTTPTTGRSRGLLSRFGRRTRNYTSDTSSTTITPMTTPRQSNYPATDQPVRLQVRVPVANAEVLFDGNKTTQAGTLREFVSPPLAAQGSFTYVITARWMENGQPVERVRTVQVQAGQRVMVDFTKG